MNWLLKLFGPTSVDKVLKVFLNAVDGLEKAAAEHLKVADNHAARAVASKFLQVQHEAHASRAGQIASKIRNLLQSV